MEHEVIKFSACGQVGKIDVISDDPQSWGRSYEREVKDYLMTRINELIAQLQLAESKVVTFYAEVLGLTRNYRLL